MKLPDDVLRRNAPYQTGIRSDPTQIEYSDEQAMLARWTPVVERHNAVVMGVLDLPNAPMLMDVDGIMWEVGVMDQTIARGVPQNVYNRVKALEAEGVPFAWWLWGDERFETPHLMPLPEPVRAPVREHPPRRDPILIGVIPTGDRKGIWVLVGKWF